MTALLLPRIWPPQQWAARRRLQDPAEALWSELRVARGAIEGAYLLARAIEHCEGAFPSRGETFRHFDALLDDWIARGLVTAAGHPFRYLLSRDYLALRSPPPPPAPRAIPFPKPTQRQRLWSAMKVLRNFDLPTLMMAAEAPRAATLEMLRILERAGWLRRSASGWTTAAARRWGSVAPTYGRHIGPDGPVTRIVEPASGAIIDLPILSRSRRDRRQDSSSDALSGGGVG